MKSNLAAVGAGALFGVGLCLSGMTRPAKVIGFLDVFGAWDASLMFVMMGAILVHAVAFRILRRRARPLLDASFHLPTAAKIDRRLVIGAGIFGIGWGLGGFCPGPALVTAGSGMLSAVVFVCAMAVGMAVHHLVHARRI